MATPDSSDFAESAFDGVFEHLKQHSEIPESDKPLLTEGLQLFFDHLGEESIRKAAYRHPFAMELINRAPWTRYELADLGFRLQQLSAATGFQEVARRLSREESVGEAMSLISLASNLSASGLRVAFEVPRADGLRVPDLKCTDPQTGQSFFVEISILDESAVDTLAAQTCSEVSRSFMGRPKADIRAKVHRVDDDKDAKEVVQRAKEFAQQAEGSDRFIVRGVPGFFEFAAAPRADEYQHAILVQWCRENDLGENGLLAGPPSGGKGRMPRLLNKISKKQRQLPKTGPNIVAIYARNFFWFFEPRQHLTALAVPIQRSLAQYRHVFATVILGQVRDYADGPNSILQASHSSYSRIRLNEFMSEHRVVVRNPQYQGIFVPATANRIAAALTSGRYSPLPSTSITLLDRMSL